MKIEHILFTLLIISLHSCSEKKETKKSDVPTSKMRHADSVGYKYSTIIKKIDAHEDLYAYSVLNLDTIRRYVYKTETENEEFDEIWADLILSNLPDSIDSATLERYHAVRRLTPRDCIWRFNVNCL